MNYKIKVKKQKEYTMLKLIGDITAQNIHTLSKKLESLNKSKQNTIVIDLSETNYIDSHGLGVFVYAWKTMEKNDKALVFLNPHDFVRNIFKGTNLDKLLRIVDTIEEI